MKRNTKKLNEYGFASIVVALALILILSLITTGFATLMRKEQRSALDKHLSSQAYYAAESGVNSATNAIRAGYKYEKTECIGGVNTSAPQAARDYLANPNVGEDDSVKTTCLLIDPTPPYLEFTLGTDSNTDNEKLSQMTGIDSNGNTAYIRKVKITWEQKSSDATDRFAPAGNNFEMYQNNTWPYATGVVRLMLMPLNSGCLSRDCLIAHNYAAFLYPRQGVAGNDTWDLATSSTGYDFNAATTAARIGNTLHDANGPILTGKCIETPSGDNLKCTAYLDGLPRSQDYMIGFRSLYQESKVRVFAFDGAGESLDIGNGQSVVDSTGKAQDVLRRIQVRVPMTDSYGVPANSLEALDGICKQLELTPTTVTDAAINRC